MYSTCLFCRTSLGANALIEAFPVGRKLAFDAAKGRLWVICPACGRWNLTPLEERWEAVEQCERVTRAARPVAATDQIALYQMPMGVRLVRVGRAMWRELALWRYGTRFRLRRRWADANAVTRELYPVALTFVVQPVVGLAATFAAMGAVGAAVIYRQRRRDERVVARARDAEGHSFVLRRRHLRSAQLMPTMAGPESWRLQVYADGGRRELEGPDALRIGGLALANVNVAGGDADDVKYACEFVEDAGSGEAYIAKIVGRVAERRLRPELFDGTRFAAETDFVGPLQRLPSLTRLALEMAVHEEVERKALDGEIAGLERAWQEAEEIAAIADDLLMPDSIVTFLGRWRRG